MARLTGRAITAEYNRLKTEGTLTELQDFLRQYRSQLGTKYLEGTQLAAKWAETGAPGEMKQITAKASAQAKAANAKLASQVPTPEGPALPTPVRPTAATPAPAVPTATPPDLTLPTPIAPGSPVLPTPVSPTAPDVVPATAPESVAQTAAKLTLQQKLHAAQTPEEIQSILAKAGGRAGNASRQLAQQRLQAMGANPSVTRAAAPTTVEQGTLAEMVARNPQLAQGLQGLPEDMQVKLTKLARNVPEPLVQGEVYRGLRQAGVQQSGLAELLGQDRGIGNATKGLYYQATGLGSPLEYAAKEIGPDSFDATEYEYVRRHMLRGDFAPARSYGLNPDDFNFVAKNSAGKVYNELVARDAGLPNTLDAALGTKITPRTVSPGIQFELPGMEGLGTPARTAAQQLAEQGINTTANVPNQMQLALGGNGAGTVPPLATAAGAAEPNPFFRAAPYSTGTSEQLASQIANEVSPTVAAATRTGIPVSEAAAARGGLGGYWDAIKAAGKKSFGKAATTAEEGAAEGAAATAGKAGLMGLLKSPGAKWSLGGLFAAMLYNQFGSPLVQQGFDTANDQPGFGKADVGQFIDTGTKSALGLIPLTAMFGAPEVGAVAAAGLGLMNAISPHTSPEKKMNDAILKMATAASANGSIDVNTLGQIQNQLGVIQVMPKELQGKALQNLYDQVQSVAFPALGSLATGALTGTMNSLMQNRAKIAAQQGMALQQMIADQSAKYGTMMNNNANSYLNYISGRAAQTTDPVYKQLLQDRIATEKYYNDQQVANLNPQGNALMMNFLLQQAASQPTADELLAQQLLYGQTNGANGMVPYSMRANGITYRNPAYISTGSTGGTSLLANAGLGG